jgi:hypothetical protein
MQTHSADLSRQSSGGGAIIAAAKHANSAKTALSSGEASETAVRFDRCSTDHPKEEQQP